MKTTATTLALGLLLLGCQPAPPPRPPAAAQPAPAPRPDPTPKALQAYQAAIREADPDGAVVTNVEALGMKGAAGVTVVERWQTMEPHIRENSAKDLHNIWVGEFVKAGGDRTQAQILIFDRHGKTIAQVHAGGVVLK
jgi:hypothetical protein